MTGWCEWRHDRKRGLKFEKSQLVEFLPGKKKVDFRGSSWPDYFVHYGRRALVGLRADDLKAVSTERWYLLPYVEKPFNSKVIKSFVPELRSRKCFFVFQDSYVIYIWTFYVHFTYSYLDMLQNAVITLKIVLIATPNTSMVFVTLAPALRAPTIWSILKPDRSAILMNFD